MSFKQFRDMVQIYIEQVSETNYLQLKSVFSNNPYLNTAVAQLTRKGIIKPSGTVKVNRKKTTRYELVV